MQQIATLGVFDFSKFQIYRDAETGCSSVGDQQAFEACRQVSYLKKQTELISTNSSNKIEENYQLKLQIQEQANANNRLLSQIDGRYLLNGSQVSILIFVSFLIGYLIRFFIVKFIIK